MPPKPRVSTPRKGKQGAGPQPPETRGFAGVSRNTLVAVAAGAVLVVLAVILASLLLAGGDDEPSAPATTAAPSALFDGIPQDGTFLGDPAATVTLIEYADMQCPFCRQYAEGIFPTLVEEYVRPGRVRMEFRGLAFLGPDSEKALRHVLAAGRQDHAWELQDALYGSQGEENSGWVTDELLREIGGAVEGLDVERMFADASSQAVTDEIAESRQQAEQHEIAGTPSFQIQIGDGEPYTIEVQSTDDFRAALDDALDG